ncbi:glycoside hydrolase domain-containing protein [Streptomyces sp. NPDC057740]|uniref:glycoside hydrolase domain-containing protein n=1 Tax=Streptomyces sp. NPDC057740 TaxID=3346234 RepID=UPI0036C4B050
MADEMVRKAQRFVNTVYGEDKIGMKIEEDGNTGWDLMHALTRALQCELGITALSNNFGPTTLSRLESRWPSIGHLDTPANVTMIIQSALYAKGYDGSNINGVYDERTAAAVTQMKQRMGVAGAFPGSDLVPKVFKALLTMDAYVVVNNGSETVRDIQRWLNGRYVKRRDFFVMPCDGHFSRDVAKSMIYAVQYEMGMSDGVADGWFGNATEAGLQGHVLSVGSTGNWVRLFSAAMLFNQRFNAFTAAFESPLSTAVSSFQRFAALPVTGKADVQTWASLLVSYGDQDRKGAACDGVTRITNARAATLKSEGIEIVGRYLNPGGSELPEKQIQAGELDTIAVNGLRCFPIYQTWNRVVDDFSYGAGVHAALAAIDWARFHGFKDGTTIYFAVDYDAVDWEVTDYIIPHFKGVFRTVGENSSYNVGIYGPRNVCQRVANQGYAVTSFVSDMSSGFSGNLGYPLPTNWAFDQIVTKWVGSGDGRIEIDVNIVSGRDRGQDSFDQGLDPTGLDKDFDDSYHDDALRDVQDYLVSIGVPETGGDNWNDNDWATIGGISTTEAFDAVISMDWLFTDLARVLRLRKALVQAPVLWELRKWNPLDKFADDAVKDGDRDDSSTGWGQIFAWVAIEARNYCMDQGIINGSRLTDADKTSVWNRLHDDPSYNISTAAYLTIYNAHQIGVARPGLNTSDADSQDILARYNGTGDGAEKYGGELIGLYQVLEQYNRTIRTN